MSKRVQITSDGHCAYLEAVEDAFGMEVDFAQLQKIYAAPSDEEVRRYSPARCIGCDLKVVSGNPDPKWRAERAVQKEPMLGYRNVRKAENIPQEHRDLFEM